MLTRQGAARPTKLLGHDVTLLDSLDRLDHLNDVDASRHQPGQRTHRRRTLEQVHKQLLCSSRWLLTEQLVDLVKLQRPRLLLNASAIGWYGRQDDALWNETCRALTTNSPTVSSGW